MSSKIKGLRRVGIVGLSTLVAASMMTLSGATSFAAAGDYTALTVAPVVVDPAPQANQAAGSVTLEFANSWATGATQTFTVGSNNCATIAGISAAVGFGSIPASAVTDPAPANDGTDTAPVFAAGVLSSSTPACAAVGIQDKVTYTVGGPSSGVAADTYLLTLSSINYLVGATTPAGNISLATAGAFKTSGSVVNAVIAGTTYTNTDRVVVVPAGTATLGTQTLVENTAGSFFGAASSTTTVVLTLSGTSVYTAGITPTITLPTGYTHSTVVTTAIGTYTFTVTSPATIVAATMKISGLTITAGTASDATLTISGGVINPAAVNVVRIVNYTARTGGITRYETAAALFTGKFTTATKVVLSGGADFPDALSANYLAGKLGTGTLLTAPGALSDAAFSAIVATPITTVYITGQTGAVSTAVQNRVASTHVSNNPTLPFINVIRLGGVDRYATNRIVNAYNITPSITVMLAGSLAFPDSLSVGPIAYAKQFPLIITRGTTLSASEKGQIADFGATNVIIVGQTGVVSKAIADALIAEGKTVTRLGGADRTLTAAAVLSWATLPAQGFSASRTYIASGGLFPDALAAGPVAGANNNMIMMTANGTTLGAGIPLYLGTKVVGNTSPSATQVGILHALGLTGALPASLMLAAANAIG